MGIYGSMDVFMVYGCLWVFVSINGCQWAYIVVYGCLWGLTGFWVSMGTYGWHECLWVLYLNIKNIAYFLIQEFQKI